MIFVIDQTHFFDNLGDIAINNDFDLNIKLKF